MPETLTHVRTLFSNSSDHGVKLINVSLANERIFFVLLREISNFIFVLSTIFFHYGHDVSSTAPNLVTLISYQLMLSSFSHMPPTGDWKAALGTKVTGILVLPLADITKFWRSFTRAILVCMMPNLEPIQILGPSLNGM